VYSDRDDIDRLVAGLQGVQRIFSRDTTAAAAAVPVATNA
jgi:hypothetical protein